MVRVSSCEDLITRLMRWETGGAGTRSCRLCSLASSWVAPISSPTWASSARRTRSCPLISSSSRSPRNTSRSSLFKMSFFYEYDSYIVRTFSVLRCHPLLTVIRWQSSRCPAWTTGPCRSTSASYTQGRSSLPRLVTFGKLWGGDHKYFVIKWFLIHF